MVKLRNRVAIATFDKTEDGYSLFSVIGRHDNLGSVETKRQAELATKAMRNLMKAGKF